MERQPPFKSRVRIPGGYGNYPGRDPESPTSRSGHPSGGSGGGGGGEARKKRSQGPWGGLFKGQEDVPLPTAPWTSAAPLDWRNEAPPSQAHYQWQQQQQQHLHYQNDTQDRTPAWSGTTSGGGDSGHYSSGATGGGVGPTWYGLPTPPRRRASPLVLNAPRLTVIRGDDYGSGVADRGSEGVRSSKGETKGVQQQRRPVGSQSSQRSVGPPTLSATAALSSSSSTGGGSSRWASWGIGRRGDSTNADNSSSKKDSNPGAEKTALLSSEGKRVDGGSTRSGLSSGNPPAAERSRATGAGSRITGEGFAAAGRRSPFLAARSSLYFSSTNKKGSTWRSPLEQSAVNPFSASFGGGGRADNDSTNPSWLTETSNASRRHLAEVDAGRRGGTGGTSTGPSQPLLRRAGPGGGYGSRWGGDGNGGGVDGWGEQRASSEKRLLSAKGRKVDDQGHQIFYKHGVRLVEAAEIQLESQGSPATYAVFILPYLFLALALWLDVGRLDTTSRSYPPSGNACDDSGVCSWAVTGAPIHNSFLVLKGDFELVDGLDPSKALDVAVGSGVGSSVGDGTVSGQAGEGGQRIRRRLSIGGGGDGSSGVGSVGGDNGSGVWSPYEVEGRAMAGDVAGEGGAIPVVDEQGWFLFDTTGTADTAGVFVDHMLPGELLDGGGFVTEEEEEEEEEEEGKEGDLKTRRRALLLPFGKGNNGDEDDDRVNIFVGAALEIRGLVEGTGEWESLYSCAAEDNVQILNCHPSNKECDRSTLGRVVFDSMGKNAGKYSEYAVKATLKLLQDGKPIPGGGGLLAQSGTFEVVTESPLFAKARSIARLPLLALTAFLLLYWMTRGFGGAGGERDPAPSAIVPERRYITLLLFGLLLWQNPVLAAEDWLVWASFDTGAWRWVPLAGDVCQFTGVQVMWLCWICLMDGQHFVRKRPQRSNSAFDAAVDTAFQQVEGEDGGGPVGEAEDESTAPTSPCFLKDDFPPHHPKSESFIDFILPKVLYGFCSLVVGVAVMLLRHPHLSRLDEIDSLKGRLELSYAVMSLVAGTFWLGWTVYFAKVAVSSGRVLRGQPFFGTRRQQLSYRVILGQGFLVAVLFAATAGIDVFYIVGHLWRQQLVLGAPTGFTLESVMSNLAGLLAWTGGIRQPLGKMILVSAACYTLAYLFLPPTHSVKRRFDRMYINMERDMPPREVVRRYKDSRELLPLFCVETSCFLVEVAWQAYYDPHKVALTDFVAPGRQDLSYLGLELVAYFNDEKHEIRAILCRGEDRLVLAFRGTARVENIVTDLKFHQVPLPQLLPPGRDRIEIQLPDGHRSRAPSASRRYSPKGNAHDPSRSRSNSYFGCDVDARGGSGRSRLSSRSRSDVSRSGSPARPPTIVGAARAARKGMAARPTPSLVARDGGGGDAFRGDGKDDSGDAAAFPATTIGAGATDETVAETSSSSSSHLLPAPRAPASAGGPAGEGNGEGNGEKEQFEEGEAAHDVPRGEYVAPSDKSLGVSSAFDAAEEGVSSPAAATAAVEEASPPPRPKNPNDLVRLFISEGAGGANGRINGVGGGGGGGGGSVVSASAAADDSNSNHADVDDAIENDGQTDYLVTGGEDEGKKEVQGQGRLHWAKDSPASSGDGSGFGHDSYDNAGDDDDLEAAAGNYGKGDFYIDPRGDGSFTTTTARCLKAIIHRIPLARHALPRVHGGFWEAYSQMREEVLAALAREMQDDYRPLYVTGHSLGGALASLAAYDISKNFTLPDPLTLYTFGSPRIGNTVFARKLNSRVKHHFRLVNDGDLVTAIPRFFGTYKHAGCKVVVDSERYGNFIVAPTLAEQTFGAKPLTSLTPHLLNQYRECLEACMEEADLEDYFSRGIGVDPTLVPEWLKGKRRRRKEDEPALL